MPVVRVVMMQRDEGDALVRWLSHYGGLFGLENLTILDNGTTDAFSLDVLRHAEVSGVRIHWGLDTLRDFREKGGHLTNVINGWDHDGGYDFALPCDCDELLAVFDEGRLVTHEAAVLAEFERLLPVRSALRIDMSMFNVPDRPGWFVPDRHFYKGFLPARSIAAIDNGHHAPESRLAPGFELTRFTYLHWHNRSYEATMALIRRKLTGRVDVHDREALIAFRDTPEAPGAHMVDTLLMSRGEYLNRYEGQVALYMPPEAGGVHFLSVGGRFQRWDAELYLAANEDVRGYWQGPLHHYLRHGFKEERLLAPVTPEPKPSADGLEAFQFMPLGASIAQPPAGPDRPGAGR